MTRKHAVLALYAALGLATTTAATPIETGLAGQVAASFAGPARTVVDVVPHPSAGTPAFFVAHLAPAGFVIVAADDDLPPVIGYGLDSPLAAQPGADAAVRSLLTADLRTRLAQVANLPGDQVAARHSEWRRLIAREWPAATALGGQVWPPAGSTPTGGWVATRWHQGPPYNDQCPMDPIGHQRSVAGCPAVAMAQIVNYHRHHHDTGFSDQDDYHHSYAGRSYWIDDDYASLEFPSFPVLTAELADLERHWAGGAAASDVEAAALVFACGVAAHQVYTSSASGTFGVDQARDAYLRFGEAEMTLLGPAAPDLYERLASDMQRGRPAHLALVDPGWQSGHNVVVDGYDSGDGRFHLNFGWGGSYDGWYLLPDEIPYGLTVIEGVIVDIVFALAADGFESGDLGAWSDSVP